MASNMMMFRTGVNDAQNKARLVILIEGETGKPGRVTLMDKETREPEMVFVLPDGSASNIAAALGLAAAMEQGELRDDLLGRNDL